MYMYIYTYMYMFIYIYIYELYMIHVTQVVFHRIACMPYTKK